MGDPTVSGMFNQAKALGVIIAPEAEAIEAAATHTFKPFEAVTLEEIRALRYPTQWKEVGIANGNTHVVTPEGDLVSASNTGAFRFVINTSKAFTGVVNIRILAKKAGESVYALQDSYPISITKSWEANTAYAHVFKRALGLSGYRHFKFEFIEPFDGALSSVDVEGIV